MFLAIHLAGGCLKIPPEIRVCEAQGEELVSPYLAREVILRGLVSVDLGPEGLMIIDEGCPPNGEGSRGINISLPTGQQNVNVGDEIRVQGIIREIGKETRLAADPNSLEILSLANIVPDPIDLSQLFVPPFGIGYEQWEGQLVLIPLADLQQGLDIPGSFQILPRVSPGPAAQLVCFEADTFPLGIDGGLLKSDLDFLGSNQQLEGLIGLVRQKNDMYHLQLVQQPRIRSIDRDHLAAVDLPPSAVERNDRKLDSSAAEPTLSPNPTTSGAPPPTKTQVPFSTPTIIPTPTYYPVRLLISEIYPNPAGEEPGGEWVEIFNAGSDWLLLDGIKIGDEISPDGREGLLQFPQGYYLGRGQILVIANQARVFESRYGFLPDFELVNSDPLVPDLHPYYLWGRSAIKLSNTGDEVLLLDPWDGEVDLVVYGKSGIGGFSPPAGVPQEGHSLERFPPGRDQDRASDWREQSNPSPGKLDRSTPTLQASQTPVPVSPTSTVTGFPAMTSSPTSSSTSLPPTNTTQTQEPAVPSDTPFPQNTPGPTVERTLDPVPSGTISTTIMPSPSLPVGTGSVTKTPASTDQITPSIEPTVAVTPGPQLLINEILADPDPIRGDSNGDGHISHDDDEFLEVVNISGQQLDLSGWQIWDGIRRRYTFPEGTNLSPGCGAVVFGGGSPTGVFGGSRVYTAGSLGLNNTGDFVSILDGGGVEITRVGYGAEGNQNQSLTRNPDLSGNLPLVLHGEVPGAGGTLFSPGTFLDGTVFDVCP